MTTVTFFFLFVLAVLFSKIAGELFIVIFSLKMIFYIVLSFLPYSAHKCYQNEEATPKAGADDECSAGHEYCAVFRCDKKRNSKFDGTI
jgi:hypothetical protein